jgi:hypothetical protein
LSFERVEGKLSSRVRRRISFGPPTDVAGRGGTAVAGTIIDEVWADLELNKCPPHHRPCHYGLHCWGDYAYCSQLIKWDDGTNGTRVVCYRRRCGEDFWELVGQLTANVQTIRTLFERTLVKDLWFKDTGCPS